MIAKVINVDGMIQEVSPANGKSFTLEELQHYVGGYVQVLPMPGTGQSIMVVDEEGKIKHKRMNSIATKLWRDGIDSSGSGGVRLSEFLGTPATVIDMRAAGMDYIAGQVLLCHTDQIE